MREGRTASFIHEVPLSVDERQERVLLIRMDQARMLYNACLGESLKRLGLVRQSGMFGIAVKMDRSMRKERSAAFREANARYGFSEYALHKYAVSCKNRCAIGDHLDVHTVQKTATRAFNAVQMHALGKRGKPRFKGKGQLVSVESKSNDAGIRFRTDALTSRVEWGGLSLPLVLDLKDKHGVQAHALSCRTKYVRVLCRSLKGRKRFYAQLVQEGLPKRKAKNTVKAGNCGLDLGPSTYAVYAEGNAEIGQFCSGLDAMQSEIRRIQRAMDRSRRANNPENYNGGGTVKTGHKTWVKSGRYDNLKIELSEIHRRLAASRKGLHGALVNRVISCGNVIHTEKLNYRAFQKMFGKSIGFRAPGMFVSMLRRKAESAGGGVIDLHTGALKLSQSCQCGHQLKKPLNERWHRCPHCGVHAQRDLYSAFLAYHASHDVLDRVSATASWPGAESLLMQAMSRLQHEFANAGDSVPQSFGLGRSRSGLPVKGSHKGSDNVDAVAFHGTKTREPLKGSLISTPRTPWL